MCLIAATVFFLLVTVEGSYAALKNQTGEGYYYWEPPLVLQQWPATQSWVSPQNWMVPQSGISSQGWAFPPGDMPMSNWVPPPMRPAQAPFLWTLFDDRNVCTLDASILVVLGNDQSNTPGGLGVNAQSPPLYYESGNDLSANAARLPCARREIRLTMPHRKLDNLTFQENINGFLINSNKLTNGQFPTIQQVNSQEPPSLPILPVSPVSCVCCGPRRFFTRWSASVSNAPSQSI
ncbi:unnamed protein product [Onchocerca flexuosa]|uniref:Secreted protein n=1 Tax=Onchocerca flexuosa TaxID=387005 RepID=A0A183H232_9BILA|nr:unnamed protein product [Onchocerca flexuosa]